MQLEAYGRPAHANSPRRPFASARSAESEAGMAAAAAAPRPGRCEQFVVPKEAPGGGDAGSWQQSAPAAQAGVQSVAGVNGGGGGGLGRPSEGRGAGGWLQVLCLMWMLVVTFGAAVLVYQGGTDRTR